MRHERLIDHLLHIPDAWRTVGHDYLQRHVAFGSKLMIVYRAAEVDFLACSNTAPQIFAPGRSRREVVMSSAPGGGRAPPAFAPGRKDRKSTRLNSSHSQI